MMGLLLSNIADDLELEKQKRKDIEQIESEYRAMGYNWNQHNEPPIGMVKAIEKIKESYDMKKKEIFENKLECNCDITNDDIMKSNVLIHNNIQKLIKPKETEPSCYYYVSGNDGYASYEYCARSGWRSDFSCKDCPKYISKQEAMDVIDKYVEERNLNV